jgi:hypothetical protein
MVRLKYLKRGKVLPQAPPAHSEVQLGDASTVAAHMSDIPSGQGMHALRRRVMEAIAMKGTMRQIPRLTPNIPRISVQALHGEVIQVGDMVEQVDV